MCYLKNLAQEQEKFDFDDFMGKHQDSSHDETPEEEENILVPCPQKHIALTWSEDQQKLINLFSLIQKNNILISSLSKVLERNSQQIKNDPIQTEQPSHIYMTQERSSKINGEMNSNDSLEANGLIQKLFGDHKYKYRIEATEKFPSIIYKQRNFDLELKLVDQAGKIIKNGNLINLCLSVSTEDAQWVLENRVGEPFMKGKTQVQLLKGECEFRKIYARDVSRGYTGGKLNIVVYCKPSTLLYSNPASSTSFINCEQIQPLIIEDITIKAKKKQ